MDGKSRKLIQNKQVINFQNSMYITLFLLNKKKTSSKVGECGSFGSVPPQQNCQIFPFFAFFSLFLFSSSSSFFFFLSEFYGICYFFTTRMSESEKVTMLIKDILPMLNSGRSQIFKIHIFCITLSSKKHTFSKELG